MLKQEKLRIFCKAAVEEDGNKNREMEIIRIKQILKYQTKRFTLHLSKLFKVVKIKLFIVG